MLTVIHRPVHSVCPGTESLFTVVALLHTIHVGHNFFFPTRYGHSESLIHVPLPLSFLLPSAKSLFSEFSTFQPNCQSLSTISFTILLAISQFRQHGQPNVLLQVLCPGRISHQYCITGPLQNGVEMLLQDDANTLCKTTCKWGLSFFFLRNCPPPFKVIGWGKRQPCSRGRCAGGWTISRATSFYLQELTSLCI